MNRLTDIIANFSKINVLVVGDLIFDAFIWGTVDRISPEAPVPVVWVKRESFMPGGAGNVANNLSSLKARVWICGVVGDDYYGREMLQTFSQKGINVDGVKIDHTRPTTLKTRVVAHHQQVVRIDKEKIEPVDNRLVNYIVDYIDKLIEKIDVVLIEDYGKGIILPELLKPIVDIVARHKKIIAVDPKQSHFSYYRSVDVITPNRIEAQDAAGISTQTMSGVEECGQRLLEELDCKMILITLGEDGMVLFEKGGKFTHIPTVAQDVFDVSGAGDTTISAFSLSLASGGEPLQSAYIANYAAGIVVGKVGVATVSQEELKAKIDRER